MITESSRSDFVKKADRVADLAFWLFLLMIGFLLIALIFKIPSEVVRTVFFGLVLAGWLIKIVESKLLRRALK